jgi:hypothetical protein
MAVCIYEAERRTEQEQRRYEILTVVLLKIQYFGT